MNQPPRSLSITPLPFTNGRDDMKVFVMARVLPYVRMSANKGEKCYIASLALFGGGGIGFHLLGHDGVAYCGESYVYTYINEFKEIVR